MLKKIISGGQTGADVAGLDVAIKHGIPHGGAIPKGRLTENGTLPENITFKRWPLNPIQSVLKRMWSIRTVL
jgi:hypothetical protein